MVLTLIDVSTAENRINTRDAMHIAQTACKSCDLCTICQVPEEGSRFLAAETSINVRTTYVYPKAMANVRDFASHNH